MKVKVISRSEEDQTRGSTSEIYKLHRNINPDLHPMNRPREYVRALNSVKLDRVFAKPFLTALSGHTDGVFTLTRHPSQLNTVGSGACDGVIKLWDLADYTEKQSFNAHDGFVRGLTFTPTDAKMILSVGEDKTIKFWDCEDLTGLPVQVFNGKHAFTSIDHQRGSDIFATSSSSQYVEIWNHARSTPEQTFSWGYGSITRVRFNPIETHLLASCTSDRAIILYDIRQNSPAKKLTTAMRSNAVAWNPRESYTLALANEDENLYQYDIRNLNKAFSVHRDHVGAILDVDYSPTGKEMVTGSYDKTIRIFPTTEQFNSREVYYTNRMKRIFTVLFTADGRFVLSGSDDMNIRLWKAQASAPMGIQSTKQKDKHNYNEKIKEKFKEIPELKTIQTHRRLPKDIFKKRFIKNEIHKAKERKEKNRQKHGSSKVPKTPNHLTSHNVMIEE